MRRRHLLVVVLTLIFGAGYLRSAQAATGTLNITLTCSGIVSVASPYKLNRNNTGLGFEAIEWVVTDGAGTQLFLDSASPTLGSSSSRSGIAVYTTAPAYNPITFKFISLAGNGFPEQLVYSTTGTCAGLPTFVPPTTAAPVFAGPGVPSGFVLRTITCDTPVYATAGGIAVPSGDAISAGQTWYINPTPVKDGQGKAWTEIFVSGYTDAFIASSCVGGKPAGYAGN